MLSISNLSKSFGGVVATNNVTLEFPKGSLSSIIGPNGAGKTTLFNLITGKLKVDSGEVKLDDENITNLSTRRGGGRAAAVPRAPPRGRGRREAPRRAGAAAGHAVRPVIMC